MSDFTSEFWSVYIALITIVSIIACGVLLFSMSSATGGDGTTGHTWDEDLKERNSPLPRWWIWMFLITLVFAAGYLVVYPGLGSYAGTFGWSSKGQYDGEQQRAAKDYGPIFDKFLQESVEAVAANAEARGMGQRIFVNNCAQCHGSDAKGGIGPNLTDGIWLYGGEPATIKTTITDGRLGLMPPMGAAVGSPEAIKDVANYVRSLSGLQHDAAAADRGKAKFMEICAACHGADGKGKRELHSANLTDADWLYGSAEATIVETITKGRKGQMPSFKGTLDEAKIHLLTAYVYGLSAQPQK